MEEFGYLKSSCIRKGIILMFLSFSKDKSTLCNSNWTEWSTIEGVIARVISKSDEREARSRFEITSTITP